MDKDPICLASFRGSPRLQPAVLRRMSGAILFYVVFYYHLVHCGVEVGKDRGTQTLKDVGFGLFSRQVREGVQEAEDPGLQEAVGAFDLVRVGALLDGQGVCG
jgi:hypothetical protein